MQFAYGPFRLGMSGKLTMEDIIYYYIPGTLNFSVRV